MRTMVMETDPFGNFLTQGYEYMSGRDWARLGNLYLQDGVTPGGERILPEGYATFVSTLAPAWVADQRLVYGAFFWINGDGAWPIPKEAYAMNGAGGQSVWMVPSHDLVIVRLGKLQGPGRGQEVARQGDGDPDGGGTEEVAAYQARSALVRGPIGSAFRARPSAPRRPRSSRSRAVPARAPRWIESSGTHAREMDPDVSARHIQLYVNNYTLALDENAVLRMLEWGRQEGLFPPAAGGLPVFA